VGEIENLPIADNCVDTIITNCVINLTPDKDKAFNDFSTGYASLHPWFLAPLQAHSGLTRVVLGLKFYIPADYLFVYTN
jgi:hypothetical protein